MVSESFRGSEHSVKSNIRRSAEALGPRQAHTKYSNAGTTNFVKTPPFPKNVNDTDSPSDLSSQVAEPKPPQTIVPPMPLELCPVARAVLREHVPHLQNAMDS